MPSLLVLSLFLVEPLPLDMPRAEGSLVREARRTALTDRFDRLDLWVSQTVVGRWADEADRLFLLARLETRPPAVERAGAVTRTEAAAAARPMDRVRANREFPRPFRAAVAILSPCPVLDEPRATREPPRGYRDVCYWQHPTNATTIVCTYRPEGSDVWWLASWSLAEGDDPAARTALLEDEFLRKEFRPFEAARAARAPGPEPAAGLKRRQGREPLSEAALLRADAQRSVAAYGSWHFTAAKEFAVLDNLPSRQFVQGLTNELPVLRARFAETLPTTLDVSEALSVARVFSNRAEYLDALEADGLTNMAWTAAFWSPLRRELVAYLPPDGESELKRTFRHEAFHQYLSYATAMIPASPWLNEGYAQYFERGVEVPFVDPADLADFADQLPALLAMDYEAFYSGSDGARRHKYRLALSVAFFLEQGAPKVRFSPFKDVKRDYVAALLETGDMRRATLAAFKDADTLRLFVSEWQKFWRAQ